MSARDSHSQSNRTKYTYDAGGKVAEIEAPSGTTIATAYAGARPKTVTITAGATTQQIKNLEFLPFGPRTRAELPPEDPITGQNTVISTRQYDLRHQVTEIDVTTPSATVLDLSYSYTYTTGTPGPNNPGPHLDRVIDHRDSSQSRFYFYDDLGRLWQATDLLGSPLYTYHYDANGNRTQEIAPPGTTNQSYEPGTDRLAHATGAAARYYKYDPFGNRIWAGPTSYAGTQSHVYDDSDRLIEALDPVTLAVLGQYTYDVFGRRVKKVIGGVTTHYFYDSAGHLLEEWRLLSSPESRDYVYVEGELLGVVDQGSSTRFAWVHTDRLLTPVAVTDAPASGAPAVVWRASYAPFGSAVTDDDPDGDLQTFSLGVGYASLVLDGEVGLLHTASGVFDLDSGSLIEASASGVNPFVIGRNDPLSGVGFLPTQTQIDNVLDFVDRTQPELDVPETVGIAPLPEREGGDILGHTTFWGDVVLDDRYLENLNCADLEALLNTIIHESIHKTTPKWRKMRDNLTKVHKKGDRVYRETEDRLNALKARFTELCQCLTNPSVCLCPTRGGL